MNKFLILLVICILQAGLIRAQEATVDKSSTASVQRWEYQFIDSKTWYWELARSLGATKKLGVDDFEMIDDAKFSEAARQRGTSFSKNELDHFNALGAEGWQFSGCKGKDNDVYVFRRLK